MKHVMLDLETLDTKPSAVILSIGAVVFDPEANSMDPDMFSVQLEVDSQIAKGRTISGSTVDWWMNQSELARGLLFSGQAQKRRRNVVDALSAFSAWLPPHAPVWGNGADFDNILLGSLYDTVTMRKPWSYSNNRCFHTLRALYGGEAPVREGTYHDARDDAVYQAMWAMEILRRVKA